MISRFFPSREELRIVIPVTLGVTLIAVIIIILVSLGGKPKTVLYEQAAQDASATQGRGAAALSLSDFLLESPVKTSEFPWKPARPLIPKWESAQIERFWEDPARAGVKKLSEENDELIDTYFLSVP